MKRQILIERAAGIGREGNGYPLRVSRCDRPVVGGIPAGIRVRQLKGAGKTGPMDNQGCLPVVVNGERMRRRAADVLTPEIERIRRGFNTNVGFVHARRRRFCREVRRIVPPTVNRIADQ